MDRRRVVRVEVLYRLMAPLFGNRFVLVEDKYESNDDLVRQFCVRSNSVGIWPTGSASAAISPR